MLSDAAKRERSRQAQLLTRAELDELRATHGDDERVARLLDHAESLAVRLSSVQPAEVTRFSLGPLTAVDTNTHYIVEITVKQKRAS